jgi:hypothetical protein
VSRKFIIVLLLCVGACAKKAPVSEDKMIDLMTDIMIFEAGQAVVYNYGNLPETTWKRDYAFICDKHKIKRETFEAALSYYQSHPEIYSRVMEKTLTRLQKQQVKRQSETP